MGGRVTRVFLSPEGLAQLGRPVDESLRLDERRAAVMARCLDRLRRYAQAALAG